MFLRSTPRVKNGKEHRYWSLVENRRVRGRRIVPQTVLYLVEINDGQKEQWLRAIEVFDEERGEFEQLKLFAVSPSAEALPEGVSVRLKEFSLHRPRQWGGCWLFTQVWKQLGLDEFWQARLGASREGTDWEQVRQVLCAYYRLIDPGSEWRLHRTWFDQSAMGDLLQADFALAAKDTLYRCLDQLLAHKTALFSHLSARWRDLFGVQFEVLLYDLTSTYFESEPPEAEGDKRRFGYSRDQRSDCVQVVIVLVVTPDGFPLADEVLAGNMADQTTLRSFLQQIQTQYGKAQRIWVMDRGIPTEEVLAEMRAREPPVHYLVGTPKGRLGKLEAALADCAWSEVREGVTVKLLPQEGELYVCARSHDRVHKERAMRKRQLKALWRRLHQLHRMELSRRDLLLKLGEARGKYRAAWRLIHLELPEEEGRAAKEAAAFTFRAQPRETARRAPAGRALPSAQ